MKSLVTAAGCALLLTAAHTHAEMVYRPVNPSFGGNPLNGSTLLGVANAQNDYKVPASSSGYTPPTALERLVSSLESRLLSQLLSDIGNGQSGSFATDNFSVDVVEDGVGGIEIQITDLISGDSTSIEVNTILDLDG